MSPSAEPAGRTLHDRIFKEFLYRFLPDFLHLFFPDKAAQLNFTTLRFLDKELVVNLPGQSLRITDVVAEVETVAGRDEVILVHVEVEASRKDTLPWRMFEYYALLRILRRKPVLPVALVLLPMLVAWSGRITRRRCLARSWCDSPMARWDCGNCQEKRTWQQGTQ
jgi:hypothetical protein